MTSLWYKEKVISSYMSDEIIYEEENGPNGEPMDEIFHVADCCRACLRIEGSLVSTINEDNDSIKYCDKLLACVSEVVGLWVINRHLFAIKWICFRFG